MRTIINVFNIPCLYEREIQRKPLREKKNVKITDRPSFYNDHIEALLSRITKQELKVLK